MASEIRQAPFEAQDSSEIARLVADLNSQTKKGARGMASVRKATFTLLNGQTVDSWRMQDWDYKKSGLPTYARGLFTRVNPSNRHNEIVVRGYDKFFNHGEIRKTEWDNVKRNTRGPYELSVKENGCIIFIGALNDETLLVCSKHSTGARGEAEKSHAIIGERWLERHLQSVGKSKADLAKALREMNATAVAELCDDAFEEHVLAYSPDIAGLYLHGINLNLPDFATYPHHLVDEFASQWGFRKVTHIVKDDINEVKHFLDSIADTGAYEGRDTEGFVIRCQAREHTANDWHDWFFKYKFEEPYLMYRQWRECTKAVIAGKPPKYKKHKKVTEEYLLFAKKQLASNPKLGKEYNHNHGIIALRDAFLKHKGTTGAEVIQNEITSGEEQEVTMNVFLVPIATIGCGKTTLGIALTKLFGWGEFQNDNVQGKARRPERFVNQCTMLLAQYPVVYADRNNHQNRERAQFISDISRIVPKATFIALHWVHTPSNIEAVRQKLRKRVLTRGDNHQTIHASKGESEIVGIMDGFVARFQPVDTEGSDADFDLVIDLDPLADTRDNLETVITRLQAEFPKLFPADLPTSVDIDEAIAYAMGTYKPATKHELSFDQKNKNKTQKSKSKGPNLDQDRPIMGAGNKNKKRKIEYFGVRVSVPRILSVLEAIFRDVTADRAKMYRQLTQSRRIQSEFHVTLMHRSHSAMQPEKWADMTAIHETKTAEAPNVIDPTLGICSVLLERVIWDDRLMCFVVRLINEEKGKHWETINRMAHITVGTISSVVKPKESNDLLAKWLEGGEAAEGVMDEKVNGHVVMEGVVKGVLQKL